MIDEEFDDFENDRKRDKNIKLLLDFESSSISYSEKK